MKKKVQLGLIPVETIPLPIDGEDTGKSATPKTFGKEHQKAKSNKEVEIKLEITEIQKAEQGGKLAEEEEDKDGTPKLADPVKIERKVSCFEEAVVEIPSEKPCEQDVVIPTMTMAVRHPVRRIASSNEVFSRKNRLAELVKGINGKNQYHSLYMLLHHNVSEQMH
eukprot:TRINITY_DN340_c1_g1_i7.p5 TRINITY_DN340_c1_g1~~TRINITY_DN340_c1_g1_i7.p5  ORF type:complete len:166 (-),score=22.13 TRINITY_DN340_c1_g1_i7:1127-1624(-)